MEPKALSSPCWRTRNSSNKTVLLLQTIQLYRWMIHSVETYQTVLGYGTELMTDHATILRSRDGEPQTPFSNGYWSPTMPTLWRSRAKQRAAESCLPLELSARKCRATTTSHLLLRL
ncbi:hypothetical protein RvY_03636-4 [Ramazzottius varieornatus]|uniref:Uncharacterized protein n=1 Tax=Ramazzottius varieornatus TaxID=947166 RepID=A0A1D1UPJ8_RAMVA|nr:hypothetical protein RvY_03636-4 [Ramazzottius varieornatus]